MNRHIVVELPTGDWAEVLPGSTLKLYQFDDAGMAELRNGMAPHNVDAIQVMDMDLDLDTEGEGGVVQEEACDLCGHPESAHSPRCPRYRRG